MAETHEVETELVFKVRSETAQAKQGTDALKGSLNNLANAYGRVNQRIAGATRNFAMMGVGALGVGFGIGAMIRQSLGANIELGKMQKNIAGTAMSFLTWKKGVDVSTQIAASMRDAKQITEEFEKVEGRLNISTEELGHSYRMLGATVIGRYGRSQEDATKLTIAAGIAAKKMGSDVGSVGAAITRVLETRSLKGNDPITIKLRSILGASKELQKMRPDKLIESVTGALTQMGAGAEAMLTFDDQIGILQKFVNDTLRDVAIPTFQYLSKLTKDWREKLEQTVNGKKMIVVYAEKILSAVKGIAGAVSTVAEHWRAIAYTIVGIKLVGLATGIAGLTKDMRDLVGAAGQFAARMAGIQIAGGAAGGAGLLGKLGLVGAAGAAGYGVMTAVMKEYGGEEMVGKWVDKIAGKSRKSAEEAEYATMLREAHEHQTRWARKIPPGPVAPDGVPASKGLTEPGKPSGNNYNFNGPINISQKFEEADPDNVYLRFRDDIEKSAEARTMSSLQPIFGPGNV